MDPTDISFIRPMTGPVPAAKASKIGQREERRRQQQRSKHHSVDQDQDKEPVRNDDDPHEIDFCA